MVGWHHFQKKVWKGVDKIRRETGTRYIQSEFVQLTSLLKIWYHYLSRYTQKERTEGDESNYICFCKIGFLDVMMWRFVDVLKTHEWIMKWIFDLTILEGKKLRNTRVSYYTYWDVPRRTQFVHAGLIIGEREWRNLKFRKWGANMQYIGRIKRM